MAERQKRQVKAPKLYDPDEPQAKPAKPKPKQVLRLLSKRDVTRSLLHEEVHVVWPDNGVWYGATVKQLKVKQLWAKVEYTETGEEEELDLGELISDGQIAIVEDRPPNHKCVKGEVPLETVKRDVHLEDAEKDAEDAQTEGDDGHDKEMEDVEEEDEEEPAPEDADDSEDSVVEQFEEAEAIAKRKGTRKRRHADAIERLKKRGKPNEQQPEEKQVDSEYKAADEKSQKYLERIMESAPAKAAHTSASFYGAAAAPAAVKTTPPKREIKPVTQTKSFKPPQPSTDATMRTKVREFFQQALEMAAKEIMDAEGRKALPSPRAVASDVEQALFKLFGETGSAYRTKAQTLRFNLRDVNNPQLRGRVLVADILPGALVQMTSEQLASQELSQWRSQRAQEALKASVLDEEAAARFSTDAARALQQKTRQQKREPDAPLPSDTQQVKVPSVSGMQQPTTQRRAPVAYTGEPGASGGVSEQPQEGGDSGDAKPPETPAAHVATDWASIKAQAQAGEPEEGEAPALPQFEDFAAFSARQHDHSDQEADAAAAPEPEPVSPSAAYEDEQPSFHELMAAPSAGGTLGQQVWEGTIKNIDGVHPFRVAAFSVSSSDAPWEQLMHLPEVGVKGRVPLDNLAKFLDELRATSRTRTLSMAVLRAPSDASHSGPAHAAKQYVKRQRGGLLAVEEGLEAYLLPPCALAENLLLSARSAAPGESVPRKLSSDELLLVIIHRKDWRLKHPAATPSPVKPAKPASPQSPAAAHAASPTRTASAGGAEQTATGAVASPTGRAAGGAPLTTPAVQPPVTPAVSDPRAALAAASASQPMSSAAADGGSRPLADPRVAAGGASATLADPQAAASSAAAPPAAPPLAAATAAPASSASAAPTGTWGTPAAADGGARDVRASAASNDPRLRAQQAAQQQVPAPAPPAAQPPPPPASKAPGGGVQGTAPVSLPAGLDLSKLGELAALLGVAAAQPVQPSVEAREAVRDPRRAMAAQSTAAAPQAPQHVGGPPGAPPQRAPHGGPDDHPPTRMFRVAPQTAGQQAAAPLPGPSGGPPQQLPPQASLPPPPRPLPAPITLPPPGAAPHQQPGFAPHPPPAPQGAGGYPPPRGPPGPPPPQARPLYAPPPPPHAPHGRGGPRPGRGRGRVRWGRQ